MRLPNILIHAQHLVLLTVVVFAVARTQDAGSDSNDGFELLPPGLHFQPLKANHQEPRVGVLKYFGTANLKVDVGNTIDVFGYGLPSSRMRFTAGIDFMAYAFVTGAQGLRLQVDALDGFFGGNITASRQYDTHELKTRLRILHLSAHLVDGHYSVPLQQWINNREPIAYTKDFGELVVADEHPSEIGFLRYYVGISYATLVRPVDLERYSFLGGFEFATSEVFGGVAGQPTNAFLADHFSLTGHPGYTGNNQIQAGVKFGEWYQKGVVVYLAYYRGNSFFSEYFDERVSIVGAGFTVDFP